MEKDKSDNFPKKNKTVKKSSKKKVTRKNNKGKKITQ